MSAMRFLVAVSLLLQPAASLKIGADPKEERVLMETNSGYRFCDGVKVPALDMRNVAFCKTLSHVKRGEKLITALEKIMEPISAMATTEGTMFTLNAVVAGGCGDIAGATALRLDELSAIKNITIVDPSKDNCKFMQRVIAANAKPDISILDAALVKAPQDDRLLPRGVMATRTTSLDQLFSTGELSRAGLIYLDVDGTGLEAIQGAKRLMLARRPIVVSKVYLEGADAGVRQAADLMFSFQEARYRSYAMEEKCTREGLAACRTLIHIPAEATTCNAIALEVTAGKI